MTIHKSVLLKESVSVLNLKKGAVVVDATLGGGGHTHEILKVIGEEGVLIGIDTDIHAIEQFIGKPVSEFYFPNEFQIPIFKINNLYLVNGNFSALKEILQTVGIEKVDAILADLGYSSDQLEDVTRGISFQLDSPLDMRLNQKQELTAREVVNKYSQRELERILKDFGEEQFYKNIVKGIIEYRNKKEIERTGELVEIIKSHVSGKYAHGKINPATRTFQALRIEVNAELSVLEKFVLLSIGVLQAGGRLAIISFHSLEDRIVKETLRENARGCICPQDFPVCLCQKSARVKIITKKPIMATANEIEINPRSRSAKLRVCEVV